MKKLFFLLFIIEISCFSWSNTGHMMIARIAEKELSLEAKKQIQELLLPLKKDYPEAGTMVTAAVWFDLICSSGLMSLKPWHYFDLIYDPDNILSALEKEQLQDCAKFNNVLVTIQKARKTLEDPQSGTWEKGFMLRVLLHCVGDIHQPFHCFSLYNKDFPRGDLGGVLFSISNAPEKNLHLLWDGALGAAREDLFPLTPENEIKLDALVAEITAKYPPESLPERKKLAPRLWAEESHNLAIKFTYPHILPGSTPSLGYLRKGQAVASKRIALAGYRLGALLNAVFNPNKKPPRYKKYGR